MSNSTNENTFISSILPEIAVGTSALTIGYENASAVAWALVLTNMNGLPFDWTERLSVGGVHLKFLVVKQLPVLPPDAYSEPCTRVPNLRRTGRPSNPGIDLHRP